MKSNEELEIEIEKLKESIELFKIDNRIQLENIIQSLDIVAIHFAQYLLGEEVSCH